MCVIGYSDDRAAFLIKNSWGSNSWGFNSTAWMSYDLIDKLLTQNYFGTSTVNNSYVNAAEAVLIYDSYSF
jgi:C1A family cysteine protease